MRAHWILAITALACAYGDRDQLALEGPAQLTVESLGPVEGPRAVFSGGEAAEGVVWEVSESDVARITDGQVVAVGPGRAKVTGTFEGQVVEWMLEVKPVVVLHFIDPPVELKVGERLALGVEAHVGEANVAPGDLIWSCEPASVARVNGAGEVEGLAPGVAYVTVGGGKTEAMLELSVVP
jgi:hypothetical protein